MSVVLVSRSEYSPARAKEYGFETEVRAAIETMDSNKAEPLLGNDVEAGYTVRICWD